MPPHLGRNKCWAPHTSLWVPFQNTHLLGSGKPAGSYGGYGGPHRYSNGGVYWGFHWRGEWQHSGWHTHSLLYECPHMQRADRCCLVLWLGVHIGSFVISLLLSCCWGSPCCAWPLAGCEGPSLGCRQKCGFGPKAQRQSEGSNIKF